MSSSGTGQRRYLLIYSNAEFVNFRLLELASLIELNKLTSVWTRLNYHHQPASWTKPYLPICLENDQQVLRLIERSLLIKAAYRIWREAESVDQLVEDIRQDSSHSLSTTTTTAPWMYDGSSTTFKLLVTSANRKVRQLDQLEIIDRVVNGHDGGHRITAKVSLNNPDHQLGVLLDHVAHNFSGKRKVPDAGRLRRVYYGPLIGRSGRRPLLQRFRLSERRYLGNTSMDVRLACLMASAALCQSGSLVFDPFVGTGSLLLSAAAWGAYCQGSDIDYALLHGIGKSPKSGQGKRLDNECLHSSFAQYNLTNRFLDVLVGDATSLGRLLRLPSNEEGIFDAILTDPPYGLREASRRIGDQPMEREPSLVTRERLVEITGRGPDQQDDDNPTNKNRSDADDCQEQLYAVPHDLPHFPHKETYSILSTYSDLLNFASHYLRPNGRLVFWLPTSPSHFAANGPDSFPSHPGLELLAACEQFLNSRNSRHLVVMRKLPTSNDSSTMDHQKEEDACRRSLLSQVHFPSCPSTWPDGGDDASPTTADTS